FPGDDLDYVSAGGYGACQILVEAVRRAGTVESGKVRDAILKLNHNTVFGPFRLNRDGIQVGHTYGVFQWQNGRKVIVGAEGFGAEHAALPDAALESAPVSRKCRPLAVPLFHRGVCARNECPRDQRRAIGVPFRATASPAQPVLGEVRKGGEAPSGLFSNLDL